jgi:KTSC domain
MRWVPVESEVFTAIGYRSREHQLYVRFHDGNIYRYFEFPSEQFGEFAVAESKGQYFARNIRGRFRYEQIHRRAAGLSR